MFEGLKRWWIRLAIKPTILVPRPTEYRIVGRDHRTLQFRAIFQYGYLVEDRWLCVPSEYSYTDNPILGPEDCRSETSSCRAWSVYLQEEQKLHDFAAKYPDIMVLFGYLKHWHEDYEAKRSAVYLTSPSKPPAESEV
jgi:hypothetical protein